MFDLAPVRTPLAASRWLTCPRPDSSAPLRLWCVPFAGGGAAVWHPWAAALTGIAEIVAIRAPGRENRFAEPLLNRLGDYVAGFVDQLAPYANEDYALCGHSLGALVVFETVRTLRRRGLGLPRALVVCAARAPHHLPDQPLLHPMARPEFLAEVERRYGPIPPEIRNDPEILDLLLPVLRADLEMYETYQHSTAAPLDLPILALGGETDAIVSRAQVLDWQAHTTAECTAEIMPGGHFFPQENLRPTTQLVRTFLARHAQPGAGRRGGFSPASAQPRPTAMSGCQ